VLAADLAGHLSQDAGCWQDPDSAVFFGCLAPGVVGCERTRPEKASEQLVQGEPAHAGGALEIPVQATVPQCPCARSLPWGFGLMWAQPLYGMEPMPLRYVIT
jgi:hypothetical protein